MKSGRIRKGEEEKNEEKALKILSPESALSSIALDGRGMIFFFQLSLFLSFTPTLLSNLFVHDFSPKLQMTTVIIDTLEIMNREFSVDSALFISSIFCHSTNDIRSCLCNCLMSINIKKRKFCYRQLPCSTNVGM